MSSYSVKKPITVLMGILIIIVLGIVSITRLPLTLFPDINLPFVVVITPYEGANPEEVEMDVTQNIEASVGTIGNFESVTSTSYEHFSLSFVTFAESANMDAVIVELRENLNNINFAEGVQNPQIMRISPDMLPVMIVNLFRDYDDDLTDEQTLIRNTEWINTDVLQRLRRVPGVADIMITGESDTVLQIQIDNIELDALGLTNEDVLAIIDAQNISGLIGIALDSGDLRMLYLGDQIALKSELENLPIAFIGGNIIRLKDVAVPGGIAYVNAAENVYSKVNGLQGIQLMFQKQADIDITEVSANIRLALDEIVNDDSINADYLIILDQGEYIIESINAVLMNIIIGGILAVAVLFIFLRDIKPTIIVGLAIPISVIAAFMLMYFTGLSLNIISMGGLALGIGMLVDNAVVVIENIYRMIDEGKSRYEASIDGSKQVMGAITASTLTTMAVFLPLAFIEGIIADVFLNMAWTVVFSLGASLFIALTLVPSMSSRFLNDHKKRRESKFLTTMKKVYVKSVTFTLRFKILTLLVVIILLAGSLFLSISRGFIMLPETDEGSINIDIELAPLLAFEDRSLYADAIFETLGDIDDIDVVSISISSGGMFFGPMMGTSGDISISVLLKDNRRKTTAENAIRIEKAILDMDLSSFENISSSDIIDVQATAQDNTGMLFGGQGIAIKISGYDLLTLEAIANDITDIVADVEGVTRAENGINQSADNVKITVNRDQAMTHGLTTKDINESIALFFNNPLFEGLGATSRVYVTIEGVRYPVEVPSSSLGNGFDLSSFGSYTDFLSGLSVFDQDTRQAIKAYQDESGESIYVPNIMEMPIVFIVNPMLRIDQDGVIYQTNDPMDANTPLMFLAKDTVYSGNTETSITHVELVTGFASINTDGTNRYVTVTGQIETGYNVTQVSTAVTSAVNTYLNSEDFMQYGGGYFVDFQGEGEDIMEAINELIIAALVAILLVYMVMAIQFQSLKYPLIIMGTIPLAFTGGFIANIITGSTISVISIVGFIILVGIVVNNGIVLIDYINKLREKGYTIHNAIIEAGQTRLRPIFMTAMTTILALVALAIGFGEGAELLQPMAITAIGGLIYATILTLVVVPTIYALISPRQMKKEAKENE